MRKKLGLTILSMPWSRWCPHTPRGAKVFNLAMTVGFWLYYGYRFGGSDA